MTKKSSEMSRFKPSQDVLTDGERQYIEALVAQYGGRRYFRIKRCWTNAQSLMLLDDAKRLRYCEGYLDGYIPHAWVTINGKVVDLTLEAVTRSYWKYTIGIAIVYRASRDLKGVLRTAPLRQVISEWLRASQHPLNWCAFNS